MRYCGVFFLTLLSIVAAEPKTALADVDFEVKSRIEELKRDGWSVEESDKGTPSALIGRKRLEKKPRPVELKKSRMPRATTMSFGPVRIGLQSVEPSMPTVSSRGIDVENVRWDSFGYPVQVLSPNGDGRAESNTLRADIRISLRGGAAYQGPSGKFPFVFLLRRQLVLNGHVLETFYDPNAIAPPIAPAGQTDVFVPGSYLGTFNGRDINGKALGEGYHVVENEIAVIRTRPECVGLSDPLSCKGSIVIGEATITSQFLIDLSGPEMAIISPAGGSVTTTTPSFEVAYHDVGVGVDPTSFEFRLSESFVHGNNFMVTPAGAFYTLSDGELQKEGWHVASVAVRDLVGNRAIGKSRFRSMSEGTLQNVAVANEFLNEVLPAYDLAAENLELDLREVARIRKSENVSGTALSIDITQVPFRQTVAGVPVFLRGLVFAVGADGDVYAVLGETVPGLTSLPNDYVISSTEARNSLLDEGYLTEEIGDATRFVITPDNVTGVTEPRAVWSINAGGKRYWIDGESGEILGVVDSFFSLNDRTAYGTVFSDKPSSGQSTVTFQVLSDAEGNTKNTLEATIEGVQVRNRLIKAEKCGLLGFNCTYYLSNDQPVVLANTTTGDWRFEYDPTQLSNETESVGFNAVNAFYHTTKAISDIADDGVQFGAYDLYVGTFYKSSYIFDGMYCNAFAIPPNTTLDVRNDSDASNDLQIWTLAPNSVYCQYSTARLNDVVIHELGHTLLYSKGLVSGGSKKISALHEGWADGLAYLYDPIDSATMGEEFKLDDGPIRNLADPEYSYQMSEEDQLRPFCFGTSCAVVEEGCDTDTGLCDDISIGPHLYGQVIGSAIASVDSRIRRKSEFIADQEAAEAQSSLFRSVFLSTATYLGTSGGTFNQFLNGLVAGMTAHPDGGTFIYDMLIEFAQVAVANDFSNATIVPIRTSQPILATTTAYRMFKSPPAFRIFTGNAPEFRLIFATTPGELDTIQGLISSDPSTIKCQSDSTCADTGWSTIGALDTLEWTYAGQKDLNEADRDKLQYHYQNYKMPQDIFDKFYTSAGQRDLYVRALSRRNSRISDTRIRVGGNLMFGAYKIILAAEGGTGGSACNPNDFFKAILFLPLSPFLSLCDEPPLLSELTATGCGGGGAGGGCSIHQHGKAENGGNDDFWLLLVLLVAGFGVRRRLTYSRQVYRKAKEPRT